MNQVYEHQGKPLNIPIIKDIVKNKLQPPMTWLTVKEFISMIEQYHKRHGGLPTYLVDLHTNTYDVLQEQVQEGNFERYKDSKLCYYRSNPVQQ